MTITLVGDVEPAELQAAVRQAADAFAARESNATFLSDAAVAADSQPAIRVLSYPDAPTWNIVSYFKGPNAESPDYAALDLGLSVLDRRLFEEVRDVRGLAYTTGASLSFYREAFGNLWITSDAPLEALPIAQQIIASLESIGPSEAELAAARSGKVSQLLSSNDTPSGIASTLADWELTAGSRIALDDYLLTLEQTTPAQVATALAAYLRDAKTAAAGGGSELGERDLEGLFVVP
jgi:predicted Zn-dependent peptidase